MPVIRVVSLVLAHARTLVRLGSKPLRELRRVEQTISSGIVAPNVAAWTMNGHPRSK
jgi:hypothetical protein